MEWEKMSLQSSPGFSVIDLGGYFLRIGFSGNPLPTLATLEEIHFKHPSAIAFENLNPLLAWPVVLKPEALFQKIVLNGRGGYCFEHNGLLSLVLKGVGFQVKGLAARVVWNLPEGAMNPRTHMVLLVKVAEELFIADVGFGGQTLTAPLRLVPDVEQNTPHEPFRLKKEGEEYILQSKIREEWKPLYRFSLEEQFLPDYEVLNWYTACHPDSHFTKGLIAARTSPECRYALRNCELVTHYLDGRTEKKPIKSAGELKEILKMIFLLNLPESDELDQALEREVQKNG